MIELVYTLVMTHITIVCVTLYLHRGQAHRSIEFSPVLSHFMRFWLWLTTGMITKQWVAIHRKHHRYCETKNDPHSPVHKGILNIVFGGVYYYYRAGKHSSDITSYGAGTPRDWIERKIYTPWHGLGIVFMLAINMLLFGLWGLLIWIVQMIWIPFWAAGVINGVGHWWGYRNGNTNDNSRNIVPMGLIIGGEELHNNHHIDPASAKLSQRWWEFDMGWFWFKLFNLVGLAKLRA